MTDSEKVRFLTSQAELIERELGTSVFFLSIYTTKILHIHTHNSRV